jgi:hypothetical protein
MNPHSVTIRLALAWNKTRVVAGQHSKHPVPVMIALSVTNLT